MVECSHTAVAVITRALAAMLPMLVACGGGAPLMHPAHPLDEGQVTMGAGFSGLLPIDPPRAGQGDEAARVLEEGAFAPGLAPWIGGRLGIDGSFEAGLTYTARAIRADIRHALVWDDTALSFGLGASGLLPKRRETLGFRVGGFGADVPVMVGWRSRADVYSGWLGVRGGGELLSGSIERALDPAAPNAVLSEDIAGWHAYASWLAGMRVGFRHLHAVFELDATLHFAAGEVGAVETDLRMFSLTPSGAIVGRF